MLQKQQQHKQAQMMRTWRASTGALLLVALALCALSHQANARALLNTTSPVRQKPRPPTQAEFASDPSAGNATVEFRTGAKPFVNLVKDPATLKRLKPSKKLTNQPGKVLLAPDSRTNATSGGRVGSPLGGRATALARLVRRSRSTVKRQPGDKPSQATQAGNQRNLLVAMLGPQPTEAVTALAATPSRALAQVSSNLYSDLRGGECIITTQDTEGWLASPDGRWALKLAQDGRVTLLDQINEQPAPIWTTPEPSVPITLPVRLCLSTSARLAIIEATNTEITLLVGGFNSPQVPGVVGAYMMDNGELVVVSSDCTKLASSGSPLSMDMEPPCAAPIPDVKTPLRGTPLPEATPERGTFDFKCPEGHITGLVGRKGAWMDAVGVECSDGTRSAIWGTPEGGQDFTYTAPYGLQSIRLDFGFRLFNLFFNEDSGDDTTVRCPLGMSASGLYGNYSTRDGYGVFSVGLYCRPGCIGPARSTELLDCSQGLGSSFISPAGTTCSAACPCSPAPARSRGDEWAAYYTTTATCTALGAWKLQGCRCGADAASVGGVVLSDGVTEPGSGYPSEEFYFKCPSGAVVTGFAGIVDNLYNYTTALGPITCTGANGGASSTVWGNPSPAGGTPWSVSSRSYTGVAVSFDAWSINSIRLVPTDTEPSQYGAILPDDLTADLSCPPGMVITGVYGKASPSWSFKRLPYVYTLGVRCRTVCTELVNGFGAEGCTSTLTSSGGYCPLSCPAGTVSTSFSSYALCDRGGAWKLNSDCRLGCSGATLPQVSDGTWGDIFYYTAQPGQIVDGICSSGDTFQTTCQAGGTWTIPDSTCPPPVVTINNAPDNKVWEVYLAEEFHKNRSDARAFCEAKGGDLLTIATQDQQTFLFDRVKFQRFWLGLSKAPDAWRWASSNQPASYTSWAVNEPQLFDGDIQATEAGLCAEFDSTSDTGPVWNSYFCDFTQPFACQLGCSAVKLPQISNATWPSSCDGIPFGKQCTATCADGFIPDPSVQHPPKINCKQYTSWDASTMTGACVPECIPGITTVTGPASGSVCAAAVSRTFTYRVSSGRLGVNVETVTVSASAGVSCTASPVANIPINTDVTVTCSRTGTNFPAFFTLTVSVVSGRGRCADPVPAQWTTTVSSSCCVSGLTYGRNPNAASCLSTIGCSPAVGFINTVPVTGAQEHPIVYGTCTSFASTGRMLVNCVNTGASTSSFTFTNITQLVSPADTGVTRNFYVGCVVPSGGQKCRADRGWGANGCSTNAVRNCGGSLTAPKTVALTCQCSSVRWIVASSVTAPTFFTAERVNGACLP